MTETCDLGKDEPHPVTGLSSSSQFIKDSVIDVALRFKKALQIVIISHGLCPRSLFYFHKIVACREVGPDTIFLFRLSSDC